MNIRGNLLIFFRGVFRTLQTSKMERFTKVVKDFQPLTIFAKRSIIEMFDRVLNKLLFFSMHPLQLCAPATDVFQERSVRYDYRRQ